jgi:hypothetical protein
MLCSQRHPKESNPFRGGTLPSASATSGSSSHRSAEDPNPVPSTPSLDIILARVNEDPNRL